MAQTQTATVLFSGGIDLVSPALAKNPGYLIDSLNYEPALNGGYRRIGGYGRFDGTGRDRDRITQPPGAGRIDGVYEFEGHVYVFRQDGKGQVTVSRSTPEGWQPMALQQWIRFDRAGASYPKPATLLKTAQGSAQVLKSVRQSGSSDDLTVTGYLLLDRETVTGQLIDGAPVILAEYDAGTVTRASELLLVAGSADNPLPPAGTKLSTATGASVTLLEAAGFDSATSTVSLLLSETDGKLAVDDLLTYILNDKTIPVGKIKTLPETVWQTDIKTTPETGDLLIFPAASAKYRELITVKQDDTETHYLRLQDLTGTIADGNTVTGQHIGGYIKGGIRDVTLPAGNTFDFCEHNFYGTAAGRRLYGCNGAGPAFELDGDHIMPVLMASDSDDNQPFCIEAHKEHLFLGFTSGKVRHSVTGKPLSFDGTLGAAEIGVGDAVTDIKSITGGVLAIACRNRLYALYGNNTQNWQMKALSRETGALPFTLQTIGNTFMLDEIGIVELSRIEAFGDFEHATVSRLAQPVVSRHTRNIVGAALYRDHNQIRYYTGSGDILVFKPEPNRPPQIMPLHYPEQITCVCSIEDQAGHAQVYFGTESGWIMQEGELRSFDENNIQSFIRTAYNHCGASSVRKAFRRLELEFTSSQPVTLRSHIELDYAAPSAPAPDTRQTALYGEGASWESGSWDQFNWSTADAGHTCISVTGTGKNLSLAIYHNSNDTAPFTLHGYTVHYIPRRLSRG